MKIHGTCVIAMLSVLFLSACAYDPIQRTALDPKYPSQSTRLEIVDKAGMSAEESRITREILMRALGYIRVSVDEAAKQQLVVEVVRYNEQSGVVSLLRWGAEFAVPGGWAHYTSNAIELRARLVRKDGSVTEFTKLAEISEAARELGDTETNMAERIAFFFYTADVLHPGPGND